MTNFGVCNYLRKTPVSIRSRKMYGSIPSYVSILVEVKGLQPANVSSNQTKWFQN